MTVFDPPFGYSRIRQVGSFHELVTMPFTDGVNALCWQRMLSGDFSEVAKQLIAGIGDSSGEGITTLTQATLRDLPVSAAGRAAIELMLTDLELLREKNLEPALNCVHGYLRDEEPSPVPTDVFSFHADSAPVPASTWLCTYHGPASEGLRNDEALRRVDVPATRAALLQLFGGKDDADFRAYLEENCYDLHYSPAAFARPFSFGHGNLWRIAVEHPGSPVPPCIHRAPSTLPGDPPRLLLIS